jgi:nitroreductase
MIDKPALTATPIHDVLARRWSGRAYDIHKPVSREQLLALLEAARWAPSCFGDQPWRYLVWDRHRDPVAWQKAFECLGEWNQNWVKNAPLLLLATADSHFQKNAKPNRWGQYDTGAASENICLQAVALGLMAHQMGGFDLDKTRKTFNIPDAFTPMAMIAVGYPGAPDMLNDELKTQELAARERHPLGERFFESAWDVPIKTK